MQRATLANYLIYLHALFGIKIGFLWWLGHCCWPSYRVAHGTDHTHSCHWPQWRKDALIKWVNCAYYNYAIEMTTRLIVPLIAPIEQINYKNQSLLEPYSWDDCIQWLSIPFCRADLFKQACHANVTNETVDHSIYRTKLLSALFCLSKSFRKNVDG